jgi:hypothetical protein
MKTIKLKALLVEQIFEANECISLSSVNIAGKVDDWKIFVIHGCIWLSFASPRGKHSTTPLIDVVLRAGQSYHLPALALQRGFIVSTFERSTVRFCLGRQVTSCNGKNDTCI